MTHHRALGRIFQYAAAGLAAAVLMAGCDNASHSETAYLSAADTHTQSALRPGRAPATREESSRQQADLIDAIDIAVSRTAQLCSPEIQRSTREELEGFGDASIGPWQSIPATTRELEALERAGVTVVAYPGGHVRDGIGFDPFLARYFEAQDGATSAGRFLILNRAALNFAEDKGQIGAFINDLIHHDFKLESEKSRVLVKVRTKSDRDFYRAVDVPRNATSLAIDGMIDDYGHDVGDQAAHRITIGTIPCDGRQMADQHADHFSASVDASVSAPQAEATKAETEAPPPYLSPAFAASTSMDAAPASEAEAQPADQGVGETSEPQPDRAQEASAPVPASTPAPN